MQNKRIVILMKERYLPHTINRLSGQRAGRKKESMNKIKFTNLSGNMGNALIKDIYKIAYRLEATEVIVNKSKYGKNATCDLFCGIDCVAHDYVIAI